MVSTSALRSCDVYVEDRGSYRADFIIPSLNGPGIASST